MRKIAKKIKNKVARENIDFYFDLLEKRSKPEYDLEYLREVLRLSQAFNIRLTREEKLKFCRKCLCWFDVTSREVRVCSHTGTKDYICKKCGTVRRFGLDVEK